MATVSITVPDQLVPRLTAAARWLFPQYAALTPTDTFKAITADHWRSVLASAEAEMATSQAKADAAGIG